jgi:hypothetical protein
MNRDQIAQEILGPISGEGYCKCPGEGMHTNPSGERDCKVFLDGAPTIHCVHSSCAGAVDEANYELRRAIGLAERPERPDFRPRSGKARKPTVWFPKREDPAALAAEELAIGSEDALPVIIKKYAWDFSDSAEIPQDPTEQFELWLKLWQPEDTLWIGSNRDSGDWCNFAFATAETWFRRGLSDRGVQTSPCTFKAGSKARTNGNVERKKYLVFESDTLSGDDQAAVLNYMRTGLGLDLLLVIHTGGKSNHGWFDASHISPSAMTELKAILTGARPVTKDPKNPSVRGWHTGLGGDPAMFVDSQPVRLPGPVNPKSGNRQRIVWAK